MIDEKDIVTESFTVIYSLPQGFRRRLEVILNDYSAILMSTFPPQVEISLQRKIRMKKKLNEFIKMVEYSKKWDENYGNR